MNFILQPWHIGPAPLTESTFCYCKRSQIGFQEGLHISESQRYTNLTTGTMNGVRPPPDAFNFRILRSRSLNVWLRSDQWLVFQRYWKRRNRLLLRLCLRQRRCDSGFSISSAFLYHFLAADTFCLTPIPYSYIAPMLVMARAFPRSAASRYHLSATV